MATILEKAACDSKRKSRTSARHHEGSVVIDSCLTIDVADPADWTTLAVGFRDYNYRHCWAYGGACARRVGATSEHVIVRDRADVVGLADVRIKRIPLLGAGIAYVSGGPLVRRDEPEDATRLRQCLNALRAEYLERRGLLLRVAPSPGDSAWIAAMVQVFRECGYEPSHRVAPYHTMLLDLAPDLEPLRAGLTQRWRRSLNRAERQGLSIGVSDSAEDLRAFCTLYDQLIARKRFAFDLDAAFYAGVQDELQGDERFVVLMARAGEEPVSGLVLSLLGDTAVFLLAASTDRGLEMRASFAVQWRAIALARERGCRWYDLGGIDPVVNPGVYDFKQGIGGVDVTAPGPFEASPTGLRQRLVSGGERLYRTVRRRSRPVPVASGPVAAMQPVATVSS